MSEVDLLTDATEPAAKPKSGLPKWLFGCGCGCTAIVVALCLLLILAGKELTDSELQWPNLREELYFEEQPSELTLVMAMGIPFMTPYQYTLQDKGGEYMVNIYAFDHMAKIEPLFKTEGKGIEKFGIPKNPRLLEIEVQGRTVRAMRDSGMAIVGDAVGAGIRIDVSTPENPLLVELRAMPGADELSEETIAEFFKMFDVWHE